jgi:hypothetical protein
MSLETIANAVLLPSTTFTADVSSAKYALTTFENIGIQLVWGSLTGTINGTYVIQYSNDGTNWDNATAPVSFSGANGNDCLAFENAFFNYVRITCTVGGITGGTIVASITLKS